MSSIIESMNLHSDPRCLKARGVWNGAASANGEKWRYELNSSAGVGSCFAWGPMSSQQLDNKVLYARVTTGVQAVIDNLDVEQANVIVRRDGWVAALAYNPKGNHTLTLARGPLVLDEVGVYSPEDWERIYAAYQAGDILYPWVAGPRNGERGPWEL